jgi:type III secretion protein J
VALTLSGCSADILHDITETEANEILAALQQRGVAADKLRASAGSKATYTVRVARGDAVAAWRTLREENLPRPRGTGLGEVFGKPSLVPTATQERALIHHAVAGELSKTLQTVAGVLEARVHVVLPTRDPLAPADQPLAAPRAAVLLRTAGPSSLGRGDVQRLVAGSVDGMKPEAVSVLIVTTQARSPEAPALARVGPFSVARSSRGALQLTLVAAAGLVLLLAGALLVVARRHRSLLRRSPAPSAPPPAGLTTTNRDPALESSLGLLARSVTGATAAGRDSPRSSSSSR